MVRIKTRSSMSRSRCHQSLGSPRKRNVSPMKPHIVFSVHGVRPASSPDEEQVKLLKTPEHIPVAEFVYAFATDTPGGQRISMMVATGSIHGSVFAVVARRKGGQDCYVMQSSQFYIDRLGLLRAELKCVQELSTLDVANALIKRCQATSLIETATPKGSKGSLERGETSEVDKSGTPSGISRSRLNEIQDRSWT